MRKWADINYFVDWARLEPVRVPATRARFFPIAVDLTKYPEAQKKLLHSFLGPVSLVVDQCFDGPPLIKRNPTHTQIIVLCYNFDSGQGWKS